MKYAVHPVGNEMEQSFPLEGFQMLSNGAHSSRLSFFIENFYCSIWRKILAGFSTQMERLSRNAPVSPPFRGPNNGCEVD